MSVPTRLTRAAQLLLDFLTLAGAYLLAFLIRFEGVLSGEDATTLLRSLPGVVLIQLACLIVLGVPSLPWRLVSILEARRIGIALLIAGGVLGGLRLSSDWPGPLRETSRFGQIPLSVLCVDLALSWYGLVGLRTARRCLGPRFEGPARRPPGLARTPTLLVGAGSAGALVGQEILLRHAMGITVVGFLDDDRNKVGRRIHGIKVLGTTADLKSVAARHGVRQVLITIGNLSGANIRRIAQQCAQCGIPIKIIPGIREMVEGTVNLAGIRDIAIEDLLQREPVTIDKQAIGARLHGRRVLITGAGGSIGSELCREVCRFGPATLVLVERAENSLFYVHHELAEAHPDIDLVPCVVDVGDRPGMERVFARGRPHVVFHAAAHKHVPMMEWNPGEAIKNNVLGTRHLADLARARGVLQFVMISTDKAVNPCSVMGVSKRIAELYVQGLAQVSTTQFVTVRFGNVLGSNGSVVPLFRAQIARGGPVTVTHPDMQRYFMTIPEACQLVLQAACLGRGGEIFILDMGEPVKIYDLARQLIRLSGLPPQDIEIKFVGLRPGEKLSEELHTRDEIACATAHPKIFVSRVNPRPWLEMNQAIEELAQLVDGGEVAALRRKLQELVPEYQYRPEPARHAPREFLNGASGVV